MYNTIDATNVGISNIEIINSLYTLDGLEVKEISVKDNVFTFKTQSTSAGAICPYCGTYSEKSKSRYLRRLQGPSLGDYQVVLHFHARIVFCNNEECSKGSFAEQPGAEIHRYQRRTRRLDEIVSRLCVGMSAEYAAKQFRAMNIRISPRQIIYQQKRVGLPSVENLSVIGIDDWAFRKGHSYGTIIVDQVTGNVVTLLDGREKDGLKKWLDKNPGILMVTRDRSSSYSKAISEHNEAITQIADRFHLYENLRRAIGEYVGENYSRISGMLGAVQKEAPTTSRSVKFNKVKELQAHGLSKREVARQSGVSPSCVHRYWNMEDLSYNSRRTKHNYERYTERVEQMHANGVPLSKIYSILTEEGFEGSLRCFAQYYRYLSKPRNKDEAPRRARCAGKRTIEHLIFRQGLIDGVNHFNRKQSSLKPEKFESGFKPLTDVKRKITDTLLKDSTIAMICSMVKDFYISIKKRSLVLFEKILHKMRQCHIGAIESLARGIDRDIKAVRNAIIYPYSNGRVEGLNNKIKALKRIMYGRGKLGLLTKRLILHGRYSA